MVFGIDLGTTNSLIGTGETLLSGLVSSAVDMSTGEQVGREVISESVYHSYKTNMTVGDSGKNPVLCSSIVLKKLAELGSKRYGEPVKDVVISVPAYFSTSQREAVKKAGEMAGLDIKCLINEPTAAAIYTCRKEHGLVVVFDLGGGTFDISIVDNRFGICSVVATDGIVLGGDDLDIELANIALRECKVPLRYQTQLNKSKVKLIARRAKEEIQRTRSTAYMDLSDIGLKAEYALTVDVYKKAVEKVFGKARDMAVYLIQNNIPEYETVKMVFVGGSSNCPYLKEMIREEIFFEEIQSDVNPDLVVAKGVALYAEMLYTGEAQNYIEDITKKLCIEDAYGRGITIIEANTVVPCKGTVVVSNGKKSDVLSLKLYQGDSLIAANNDYIGTLRYDYGRVVEEGTGMVEVTVHVGLDGIITLEASDVLEYGLAQAIRLSAR